MKLSPETLVADGKHLIEQQDFRVEIHRNGKGETREHSRRVGLHRAVDRIPELGVFNDVVVALVDLFLRQPGDETTQVNVATPRELCIEANPELEKRRHATTDDNPALVRT